MYYNEENQFDYPVKDEGDIVQDTDLKLKKN